MKKIIFALLTAALLAASILPIAAEEGAATEIKPGTMIYEQNFDMPDAADQATALAQLNWTVQTKALKAYTDPTANIVISDGRLQVTGASDTYYLMLTEEQMAPYDGKTITIQYEMEYTTASNASRYFCILANYAGQKYNSFHFRNSGNGNNQAHIDGSWVNYDAYNPSTDIFAPANDTDTGSSIGYKLLGTKYNSNKMLFSGVPVTVRYVLDPSAGISVYMKLAEKSEEDFVLVSATDPAADGTARYGTWDANAICLKIGGQQNGYIDNIAIWTGSGDYPQPEPEEVVTEENESAEEATEPEQTVEESEEEKAPEEPKKVREPHTIVNKIAIWAVALFGGFIIYKKGKEENSNQ